MKTRSWLARALEDTTGKPSHTSLQSFIGVIVASITVIVCIVRDSIPALLPELLGVYMFVVVAGRAVTKWTEVKYGGTNDTGVPSEKLEASGDGSSNSSDVR